MRLIQCAAIGAVLVAAGSARADETRTAEQPVIYGQDDRYDVVAHPNAELRAIASGSVGALVAKANVSVNASVRTTNNGRCTRAVVLSSLL